jgi:type IV pilus assembly protein PilN
MIRINLLKAEAKALPAEAAKKEKKAVNPSMLFGLGLVVLVGVAFLQLRSVNKEKALLTQAENEKAKLQDVESKLKKVEAQKKVIEKKISLIGELKNYQQVAVRIMDEISQLVPSWVWLDEIAYDNKSLQIKGKALSNSVIAEFISNMEKSTSFRNINLISSIQRTIGDSRVSEFSLTASYIIQPLALPAQPSSEEDKEKEKK